MARFQPEAVACKQSVERRTDFFNLLHLRRRLELITYVILPGTTTRRPYKPFTCNFIPDRTFLSTRLQRNINAPSLLYSFAIREIGRKGNRCVSRNAYQETAFVLSPVPSRNWSHRDMAGTDVTATVVATRKIH